MGVIITTIFLLILGIILLKLSKEFNKSNEEYRQKYKRDPSDIDLMLPEFVKFAGRAFCTLSVVVFLLNSYTVVNPGHQGIVTTFGKISKEPLNSGLNFLAPWSSVKSINIQEIKDEEKGEAETADTQTITVKGLINFRPPTGQQLTDLYVNVGENWSDIVVSPAVKEAFKAEISKHKVTDVVTNRPIIKAAIQEALSNRLRPYGITVINISISDIDFSDQYDKAIETKQVEEQRVQQRTYELQQRETEAKMAKAKADGEAESAIAAARGQAESVKLAAKAKAEALQIEGEAQALYNKRVAESLTPTLMQKIYIEKWSGTLPQYLMGDSGNVLLNIPAQQK